MRSVLPILLVAVALAGCASNYGGSPATTTTPASSTPAASTTPATPSLPANASVGIANFAFQPSSVHIAVGGGVTWTNGAETTSHTVTADDGSFDSGVLAPGASFTHAFAAAGTYRYHCSIHGSMVATIVVG